MSDEMPAPLIPCFVLVTHSKDAADNGIWTLWPDGRMTRASPRDVALSYIGADANGKEPAR